MCWCANVLMCWCVDVVTCRCVAHFLLYADTQNILTDRQMHFVFMAVILLHSGHQHVVAGHVATCTSLHTERTCGEMWCRFVSGDTVCTANCSTVFNVIYFTLIAISFYYLTTHFNESYLIFKLWSNLETFNYICVLVLTTLKVATWLAATCWWRLCNKITAIKTKCICSPVRIFCVSKGRL
jgi:hypothetical protein